MNENSSPGNTSLDNNNSIIQQQLAEARELSKKSLKQLSTEGKALFREASDDSSDTDSSALSPEQQLAQQERLSDEILANYSIYNTGAETNLHGDIWNAPFKMLPIFETPPFSNDTISCQMTFFHRAHGLSLLIKFPSTYPNDTNLPGSIPSFVVQNLNGYVKLSELTLQNFTKAMDTIAIASNGTECVYLCIEEFNQLMHSMIGGRIDQTQQKSWIESLKSGDAIFAIYQDGCEYNAHIVRVGRTACRVQWDDFEEEYSTVSFQNITKVSNILKQHEPSETTITLPKTVDINILLQKQKTPQPTSNFSTTSKLSKLSRSSRSSRSNKQGETKTELIDSNATFLTSGVQLNMIIVNTTDNTQAVVIGIENDTTLTVSANIFAASGKAYEIYGGHQEGAVLYIGTAGNLKVTTVAGDEVTFQGINTGAFFPVHVKKVWATGTSASNIIALW